MSVKCNVFQCEFNKENKCVKDNIEIDFFSDEYEYAYCCDYKEKEELIQNKYHIEKINNNDEYLVIIKTADTGFDYIKNIIKDINKKDVIIIFDHLLHNGNTEDRFIMTRYINDVDEDFNLIYTCVKSEHLNIPKKHKIRKISDTYFKDNPHLIESSILTSIQKKMILKGRII